jgi:hypothetical protein
MAMGEKTACMAGSLVCHGGKVCGESVRGKAGRATDHALLSSCSFYLIPANKRVTFSTRIDSFGLPDFWNA